MTQGSPSAGAGFELEGVSVSFGGRGGAAALDSVDLRVSPGTIVAVVGPSGAGKTTLLRVLGATQRASSGRVVAGGLDLGNAAGEEVRQLRTRLGFVPQRHGLLPALRVSQNVIAGRLGQRGFLSGVRSMLAPGEAELAEALDWLTALGIGDKLFQRADKLSGGEAQRVAVARALFQRPRALLADEPVASVDPERARDLLGRVLELARESGQTVVTSLHDVELARALFPRIVGLRAGRVLFDRGADQLDASDLAALYRIEERGG